MAKLTTKNWKVRAKILKNNLIYQFLRIIFSPIFKLYYNVKIIDKKFIPKKGPFIICGNHLNAFDQFPVIVSTSRTIHWLSKKEYFEGKLRFFFEVTKCICVDRNAHDGKAFNEAINYLRKNESIGLFPEGTRNKTSKDLLKFKKGAVRMAKITGVPIIPFAVNGDFSFRSKNLIIRFGEPILVKDNDDLDAMNKVLRERILELQRLNKMIK